MLTDICNCRVTGAVDVIIRASHLNLHLLVIGVKQFSSDNMDVSSLDSEIFPMEEDLVNYTQQVSPAHISIPPQVLLEEISKSGLDGKLYNSILYMFTKSYYVYKCFTACLPCLCYICRTYTNCTCYFRKLGEFPT